MNSNSKISENSDQKISAEHINNELIEDDEYLGVNNLEESHKNAIQFYVGDGYKELNLYLRGKMEVTHGKNELLKKLIEIFPDEMKTLLDNGVENIISNIDNSLSKIDYFLNEGIELYFGILYDAYKKINPPAFDGTPPRAVTFSFRGLKNFNEDYLKPGTRFVDPSFLSTSAKESVALELFRGNTFIEYVLPKGHDGKYINRSLRVYPGESEILFLPKTEIRVDDILTIDGGKYKWNNKDIEDICNSAAKNTRENNQKDIDEFIKKEDIIGSLKKEDIYKFIQKKSIDKSITNEAVDEFIKKEGIGECVTKEAICEFITKKSIDEFIKKFIEKIDYYLGDSIIKSAKDIIYCIENLLEDCKTKKNDNESIKKFIKNLEELNNKHISDIEIFLATLESKENDTDKCREVFTEHVKELKNYLTDDFRGDVADLANKTSNRINSFLVNYKKMIENIELVCCATVSVPSEHDDNHSQSPEEWLRTMVPPV